MEVCLQRFVYKNVASTTGEVISSDEDRLLKISANLQMSYLRNEVGDPHFFFDISDVSNYRLTTAEV